LAFKGSPTDLQLFWKNLAPTGSEEAKVPTSGALADQINADFGSFENLKKELNTKTAAVQGSGWGWLGFNKGTKKLEVVTTPNQDPLLSTYILQSWCRHVLTRAHVPIIGIDIWEHAFYLQYKNVKPDVRAFSRRSTFRADGQYLNAIWDVINYKEAESRLVAAKQ